MESSVYAAPLTSCSSFHSNFAFKVIEVLPNVFIVVSSRGRGAACIHPR